MEKSINWALVGTGWITDSFLEGLREAGGNAAAVVSRSAEKAQGYARDKGIAKAFGSYARMLEDPEIEAVYIGTPHTSHMEQTVRALKAGKAVLCEKPFALNAGEAGEMVRTARENGVFLMEAMWTRFLPAVCRVRQWLSQGLIGEARMVQANFGFRADVAPQHRLLNPALGGGALLDVGVYTLSFASMVFSGRKPEAVTSRLVMGETGVDEEAVAVVSYGGSRLAVACAAVRTTLTNDAWIYGSKGKIHVPDFFKADRAELFPDGGEKICFETENQSGGYSYEAGEVMDCIRSGKTESQVMPLDESLVVMETMDRIREQWGFRYPSEV
jgi:predicted dehydrogenase